VFKSHNLHKKSAQRLTAALRNAGFCNPKSHQVVWEFPIQLIHFSKLSRAAQSRGPLAVMPNLAQTSANDSLKDFGYLCEG
jgi:hypothetical protein